MTDRAPILCRTCGKPVYGVPTDATQFGKGWIHVTSNREKCPPPHRAVAEPATIAPQEAP